MRSTRTKGEPSVLAEMTCIAMGRQALIKAEIEICGGLGEDGSTGVAKALVPKIGGDGGGEAWTGRSEGVQIAGGVTSEKHRLGCEILDRETIWVKFSRD